MSAYNKTTMSGFIPADSILAGWLSDKKMPVVRFEVVCGKLSHPVFIVEAKPGVEMFAWKMSMRSLGANRVHVVVVSDVVSYGNVSALVTKEVDFHTSNPDLRVEVDRRFKEMLAGQSPLEWPERIIKMPVKVLRQLNIGGS